MTTPQKDRFLQKAEASQTNEDLAEYYNAWAPNYEEDSLQFGYHRVAAVVASLIRRYVEPDEGKILDAGAGTGMLGDILALIGYKGLVAIDISPGMLEEARKKKIYQEIRKMLVDAQMDFPPDKFAAVVAMGVFTAGCHIPPESFYEFIRITRPSGHIVFSIRMEMPSYKSYKRVHDALVEEGKWQLVEATNPFQSLPLQNPKAIVGVKVFKVL